MNHSHDAIRWEVSRGRWTLGDKSVSEAERAALNRFFIAMRGRAYGFRFSDWQRAQR